MTRLRAVLGLVAGAMLVLSSAAHSLLGWRQLRTKLVAANTPSDLVQGLEVGWHFGGAAMLALGCIVIALFAKRLRGQAVSSFPALIIAILYVGFGIWALSVSSLDPFFLIFIVPGVLLALAVSSEARQRSL